MYQFQVINIKDLPPFLELDSLVERIFLMNQDTMKPILNKIRNKVDYWSKDLLKEKLSKSYPVLCIGTRSELRSIENIEFVIAASLPHEYQGDYYSKLDFAAYSQNVPRDPKEIRRNLHQEAYRFFLPLLLQMAPELRVFVQIPEKSIPIINLFKEIGFSIISDPRSLLNTLESHRISYLQDTIDNTADGLTYQVHQQHTGKDDGTRFYCLIYNGIHKSQFH
jgi:hypothetical protein